MWDDAGDDLEDDEFPDEDDPDEDDATIPCPFCRKPVYEDAERCPACGSYFSREDRPWSRPIWLVAGVIVCLVIVLMWTLR